MLSVLFAGHPGWKEFQYPCGINLKGIVECVGYYDQYDVAGYKATRHVAPVYRSRRFKQISTDKLRTCGITHNDRLICWGFTDFGTYTTDDSMVFPCGWTQMIRPKRWEYRTNDNGVRVRMRWRWKWVSVGGGGIDGDKYSGSVCGVRLDGKIRCYGCNEAMNNKWNLQSSQPRDIESWKKVEVTAKCQQMTE